MKKVVTAVLNVAELTVIHIQKPHRGLIRHTDLIAGTQCCYNIYLDQR